MSPRRSVSPSIEQNKTLARKLVEEVWNEGNFAVLAELFDASGTSASIDPQAQSVEQMQQVIRIYRTGLPDLRVTIDQLVAEGDAVMVRWTASGTHTESMMGIATAAVEAKPNDRFHLRLPQVIPPTKQRVSFLGVTILWIASGRITAAWLLLDEAEVMRKLGALPIADQSKRRSAPAHLSDIGHHSSTE